MFSDDAYNKSIGRAGGAGTLVGNWEEERFLRETCGEGRTVPQRHLPRSGLLKDFTKQPVGGTRPGDNTFERCRGPPGSDVHKPSSTVIGEHFNETVSQVGPRTHALRSQWLSRAEDEVQAEEEIRAQRDEERYFHTTHGATYTKPDDTMVSRAQHLRTSYMDELEYGQLPDSLVALRNEGLDVHNHSHYANVEGVSHPRVQMSDATARNDMKVSACGGIKAFGKHSEFSKPINEFTKGLAKDEELSAMYAGLQETRALRTLAHSEPGSGAFRATPSLPSLKVSIHDKLGEVWGKQGYVLLRQRLFDVGDHEGYVAKEDIAAVLRGPLGLTEQEVTERMLDIYLGQLVTMKKRELKIGSFMTSLRPVLLVNSKKRAVETYRALAAANGGCARLGDWLARLQDDDLRNTIVSAFGAQQEHAVVDMPLSEQVFIEVVADLAPFMNVEDLLK